jgi:hypothetical protein
MAALSPLSRAQFFQQMVEAYNAAAISTGAPPADTGPGSSLGPFFNAVALMLVQQQGQIAYVNARSRLATSFGADVDTFVNPWNEQRIAATFTIGPALCSTPSPVPGPNPVIVPVGAIVSTPGGLKFTVIADGTNPNYNVGDNGYPIATGFSSTTVTVQCNVAGTVGNIAANQLSQIFGSNGTTPLPNIGTVTNTVPFTASPATPAVNAESDAAEKARFTNIALGGSVGTGNAMLYAAGSVQAGLTLSYGDQINPDGSPHPAFFTMVVNVSGSGTAPSSNLIAAVVSALNAVRSGGISFTVIGPTLVPVNASST